MIFYGFARFAACYGCSCWSMWSNKGTPSLSPNERCSHVHRLVHVELTVRCARATHRAAADSEQRLQSCNLFTSSAGM